MIKCLLLLCCLHYLPMAIAQNNETALFQQVFKNRSKQRTLSLPIYIDQQEQDEVLVVISNPNKVTKIETASLLQVLKNFTIPTVLKKIQHSLSKPWCTPTELAKYNIGLKYDYQNLALHLQLPLAIKIAHQLDLSTFRPPRWVKNPIEPASFSHYTNLQYFQTFSNESAYRRSTLDIHSVTNMHQYILSIDGSYHHQDSNSYWQRDEITLTKDLIRSNIRLQLGDINYATRGHQMAQETLGVQFYKEFIISPYTTFYPNSNYEFSLPENSDVEVYINNHLVRTLSLRRGKHSLKDLPLNQGINDIKLKIKDKTGREETIEIPAAMSFNLLKKGTHQFSYALGVSNHHDEQQNRIYETANPLTSFFHYYGVTSNYTLGHYGQWKERYFLLGQDQIYSSPWGEFALDTAATHALRHNGAAATFSYKLTLYSPQLQSPFDLSLQLDYKSPYFFLFDQTQKNAHYFTVSSSIGIDLLDLGYMRFGARYTPTSLATEQDYYQLNLTLNKHLWHNLNTNIQLSHTHNHTGDQDSSIALYLNLLFPQQQQNLMYSYDSLTTEQNLTWDYNQAKRSHKWNARAALRHNNSTDKAELSTEYVHDRFSGKLIHISTANSDTTINEERININTAIAYVGKHWTISHPIYESFALIQFDKAFAPYPLYLNSTLHDYEGSSKLFNDLVISNLQDYRYQNSNISSFELPPGFSLPQEFYSFHALNHSGNIICVKNLFKTAIHGVFYLHNKPWSLQSGQLIHLPTGKHLNFFTNRKGKFFVEGLSSGQYSIFSNELEQIVGSFTLNSQQHGIINLGKVIIYPHKGQGL